MDQVTLLRALGMLGIQMQDLDNLRRIQFQQAVEILQKLKDQTKTKYKKLAFELHPDRTGGDEEKTKLFSDVTAAHKWFQDLRLQPPAPQQIPIRISLRTVHYPRAYPFGGSVTATTTASTTTSYNAARVVFIKVS
jgi:hypothetical protein